MKAKQNRIFDTAGIKKSHQVRIFQKIFGRCDSAGGLDSRRAIAA